MGLPHRRISPERLGLLARNNQPGSPNGRRRRTPCGRLIRTGARKEPWQAGEGGGGNIHFLVLLPCMPSLPDDPTLQASSAASQDRPSRRKLFARKVFTPSRWPRSKNRSRRSDAGGPATRGAAIDPASSSPSSRHDDLEEFDRGTTIDGDLRHAAEAAARAADEPAEMRPRLDLEELHMLHIA